MNNCLPQHNLYKYVNGYKYTTRLEPSLVKKIRLHAIEKDKKDYEVVRDALNQYFERNT
jgi:hypothetical protein